MFPDIATGKHTIGEYITLKRGKGLVSKNAVSGEVPVVAGGLKPAFYHNKANTTAPVITVSASGSNVGYVQLWSIPVWSSDSSFIDSTMTEDIYFWYVMLKKRQEEIYKMRTGSVQQHIYPKHIEILPVIELNEKDISEFNNIVSPLFNKTGKNQLENKRLSALRDALLPKLLNEEIKI
ncbi:MAG: restriction endonuclease subunit S [Ruminococcus sp.]|nr:restriction endonuclease subunit S [Ruminococcus sp.]